ncbi:hypothetical protein ABPG72_021523 [Tetrahymena utriculariae]
MSDIIIGDTQNIKLVKTNCSQNEEYQMKQQFIVNKQMFFRYSNKKKIRDDYKFLKELGSGAFGVVFLATHRITGDERAVKAVAKDRLSDKQQFQDEINILKELDHPNIVKLYEVYESESTIYLVTEYCEGGELFQYVVQNKRLQEKDAALIMRQLFSAVSYIHDNGVIHRDLKPENFLLKKKSDPTTIKMIDFGISKKFKKGEVLRQQSGTPYYIAPEVIEGQYSEQVDNWALGVILYILLSGTPPFYGKNAQEIFYSIRKCNYNLNLKAFLECSNEVRDLISRLLVKNPKKRLSDIDCYNHPWVQQQVSRENQNLVISSDSLAGLKKIVELKNIKKTILIYMASQIQDSDLDILKQIFVSIDRDGNGRISLEELKGGLHQFKEKCNLDIQESEIKQIFQAMDFDNSGQIDYSEFIATFLANPEFQTDKAITQAFLKIDKNNDGKLTKQELQDILGTDIISMGEIDIDELIKEADTNGDGEIDFTEFLTMLREKRNKKRKKSKTKEPTINLIEGQNDQNQLQNQDK